MSAEKHLKAVIERDKLASENMNLRRSATPRPNWDKLVVKILEMIMMNLNIGNNNFYITSPLDMLPPECLST